MRKVRVLIVDDSAVIRRLLSDALAGDPAIEVAGVAANGRIALAKLPQINPDAVTLDLEMPDLDGLATLAELRKTYPRLPVIMFSTLTQKGAVATLDALSLGASDYVTKPANVGSVTAGIASVRGELIPKLKALCRYVDVPATGRPRPATGAVAGGAARLAVGPSRPAEIVAIGVSTGGPNALTEVLGQLPANLAAPVVIVQHMPPLFTKFLAERLNLISPLHVREATAGALLAPGDVWLAPGDFHLVLARTAAGAALRLHQGPPENSCRPAVDVLFRSVVGVFGPAALAVVLTGMGQDGLLGCQAIRDAGGRVIAQDEPSSVVWGMPGAVATAGLAQQVLPLARVAGEIARHCVARRAVTAALAAGPHP